MVFPIVVEEEEEELRRVLGGIARVIRQKHTIVRCCISY